MRIKREKTEVQAVEELLRKEGFTEITNTEKRSREFKKSIAEFTRAKPSPRVRSRRKQQ
ncbi:MAG TPA: hypothetical protein PKM65_13745 [Spirochaetota bacterium]|nr:hypothetical protein [Spirochaetota bacterium]HNT11129.1 hypothetical protein [Spirochaetota bacterium]